MKLDPDIHIGMHSVLSLKPSVTPATMAGARGPRAVPPTGDAGEGAGGWPSAAGVGRERREAARAPPESSRAVAPAREVPARAGSGVRALGGGPEEGGGAGGAAQGGRSRGGGAAGEEGKDPVRRSERREGEKKRKERRKEGMTGGPHLVVVGIE